MNTNSYIPNPHVLIVVEKPNEKDREKWDTWNTFLNDLKANRQSWEGVESLSENVWQFPMPLALLSLHRFLGQVESGAGIKYKLFYCDSKIQDCK
jgi:hypothetical protein